MKTLNYIGFSNNPASCQYGIGTVGGKDAIIFYQSNNPGTSITNMIEVLTGIVLSKEFPGKYPSDVRVFEHYDPKYNPLIEWQEVRFKDYGVIDNSSKFQKIVALVLPNDTPPEFYVDDPIWLPVSAGDLLQASAIK